MEPVLDTVWLVDCVSVKETSNGIDEVSVAAEDMVTLVRYTADNLFVTVRVTS